MAPRGRGNHRRNDPIRRRAVRVHSNSCSRPECPANFPAARRREAGCSHSSQLVNSPILGGGMEWAATAAQGLQVAVESAEAAAVAEPGDLGVQQAASRQPSFHGGSGGLVAVQDRGPGQGPGHRVIGGKQPARSGGRSCGPRSVPARLPAGPCRGRARPARRRAGPACALPAGTPPLEPRRRGLGPV